MALDLDAIHVAKYAMQQRILRETQAAIAVFSAATGLTPNAVVVTMAQAEDIGTLTVRNYVAGVSVIVVI